MPTMYHSRTALHIDRFPGKQCSVIHAELYAPQSILVKAVGICAANLRPPRRWRYAGGQEAGVKKAPSRAIGRRRVLEAAALLGLAALTPARAANAQTSRKATPAAKTRMAAMSNDLSADEIRTLLQLEPNATCGFARVTFVSKQSIAAGGLPPPFAEERPLGS